MAAQVDMKDYFMSVIKEASNKWEELADELGFDDNEIDVIRDLKPDDDHRCREVLRRWRNREGRKATLQVLQQALIEIDQGRVAQILNVVAVPPSGGDTDGPMAVQVDMNDYFMSVIKEASNEWEELALKLGFSVNEIDVIRDLRRDDDRRCKEMLTRWRNREGRGATLQVLKQALVYIGQAKVAQSLDGEGGISAPRGSGAAVPVTPHGPKRTILLINDEYGTSKGGVSTINYQAGQMLAAANAIVYATALRVPKRDQEAADRDGVLLIGPDLRGKTEPTLDWLTDYHSVHYPNLPKHVDCIIGHAPITNTAARNIWEQRYPQADLMSFNHVLPEDTEYYKGGRKPIGAWKKEEDILDKVNNALAAFSVGKRIYDHYVTMYKGDKKPRSHYIFLPKPSEIFLATDVTPGGQQKVVLSIGRVRKVEKLKGHDLVAESMGYVVKEVKNVRLRVRGISEDDWETSKKILEDNLKSGDLNPTLLPYGTQEDISNDMKVAHLVLMPSRSEPFGLVGLEAIAAGIPVLISDKTGLAEMIMDLINQGKLHPDHRHVIVETSVNDSDRAKDVKRWADRIVDVLKYSDSAFQQAARLKRELVESRYWEESHRTFLQACGILAGAADL